MVAPSLQTRRGHSNRVPAAPLASHEVQEGPKGRGIYFSQVEFYFRGWVNYGTHFEDPNHVETATRKPQWERPVTGFLSRFVAG